ncbi:MAG: MurR/RpiR family transcriptional regulator [Nitrospinota bacterium]|nr:MurR/RpiR family transcriptional regulator [Nitrospinota bacterium]
MKPKAKHPKQNRSGAVSKNGLAHPDNIQNWDELRTRLKTSYDEMSRTHKKIADAVLNSPNKIAVMTIRELARDLICSEGTILRFCARTIGGGYSNLAAILRRYVQMEWGTIDRLERATRKMSEIRNGHPIVTKVGGLVISNIEKAFAGISEASFDKAVELIRSSKGVTVIGQRSSYALAFYLNFILQDAHPRSRLLDPGKGIYPFEFSQCAPDEVFVIFCFTRYTKWVCRMGEIAAKRDFPIILVTDDERCPLWNLATVAFEMRNESLHHMIFMEPAMALSNALISALVAKDLQNIRKRLAPREKLIKQMDIFSI